MRASFYVVVWAQMMLADVKADKKWPTEVGHLRGGKLIYPAYAPGSGR